MNGKLKLAICFFGHLRTFKKCAPFLHKNLFKYYNFDLFMHTWSELDHNTQSHHGLKKIEGTANREDILRAYGELKGLKIEEQKPQDSGNIVIKRRSSAKDSIISIFGINQMYHSMRESLHMCEEYSDANKIEYDYILFIRPDIWLKNPLVISDITDEHNEQETERGFFTLSIVLAKTTAGFMDMGCLDICFFAKPKTMSDIINNSTLAVKELKPDAVINYCAEYNLIKLVKDRGFTPYKIEQFHKTKDWDILRSTNSLMLRRRIIKKRINKKKVLVWFFPNMMVCIFNIQVFILGYTIDLAVGNPGRGLDD